MSNKHVVFDLIGTLLSYDRFFQAIDTRLGDKLRAEGIKPSLLGYTWVEVSEREYTYFSISGRYIPLTECMTRLFYRMLWMAGISEPREFANDEDLTFIMDGYQDLPVRPGAVECVAKLREAGFVVWGLTAGDLAHVTGCFIRAGIDMPPGNILSCDSSGVGKPDPVAYSPVLGRISKVGKPWFAAAHAWDVSAAKRTG
jgi:2-haloacid dehalogenase